MSKGILQHIFPHRYKKHLHHKKPAHSSNAATRPPHNSTVAPVSNRDWPAETYKATGSSDSGNLSRPSVLSLHSQASGTTIQPEAPIRSPHANDGRYVLPDPMSTNGKDVGENLHIRPFRPASYRLAVGVHHHSQVDSRTPRRNERNRPLL